MFALTQAPMLLCEVCGQPLPDDEMKAEMALFGVERRCWKCGQPGPGGMGKKRLHDPCFTCRWGMRRRKLPSKCGLPKDRPMCGQEEGERVPSGWESKVK